MCRGLGSGRPRSEEDKPRRAKGSLEGGPKEEWAGVDKGRKRGVVLSRGAAAKGTPSCPSSRLGPSLAGELGAAMWENHW